MFCFVLAQQFPALCPLRPRGAARIIQPDAAKQRHPVPRLPYLSLVLSPQAHNTPPLLQPPQDALEYGLIDEIIQPDAAKQAAAAKYWLQSGRAESEGRLEQWKEYIDQQVGLKSPLCVSDKCVCWGPQA